MLETSIRLVDAFALLALRDEDGKRVVGSEEFNAGLGGGLLAELAIAERVAIEDDRVVVRSRESFGEPLLDETVARIAGEGSPRKASWWVRKLGSKEVRERVLGQLVERGALREETSKALGLFSVNRFPAADGAIEERVRTEVAGALEGHAEPDARISTLVGLCDATGVLKKAIGPVPKDQVKRIVEADWASPAVRKVIKDANTAVTVGIVAALNVSTHAAQGI